MTRRLALAACALALLGLPGCASDSSPAAEPSSPAPPAGDVDRVPGHVVDADSLAVSPDGAELAAGCGDELCVWTTADGSLTATYAGGNVVAWGPDVIATSDLEGDAAPIDLLSPDDGSVVRTLDGHDVEEAQDAVGVGITALAFDPDGARLASAGHDGTVRVWSVDDGEELTTIEVADARALVWSPDGTRLAVAAGDRLTTYDAGSGEPVAGFLPGRAAAAYRFALADDVLATTVAGDEAVHVGRTELTGHTDQPRAVAWSPDGGTLYSASSREVLAWDPRSGQQVREFELP